MKKTIGLTLIETTAAFVPLILLTVMVLCISARNAEASGQRTLVHDGITRTYLIQKPAIKKQQKTMPLVILLHGGTQSARKVWQQTSLPEIVLAKDFILVAPDAVDGTWNDGREALYGGTKVRADVDDVGFISKLIDEIVARDGADPLRVYVTGASNGGMMTFRLSCELADKLAAAAPFIATMKKDADVSCKPPRALPIMITISTEDPFVSWDGAAIVKRGKTVAEPRLSAEDTVSFWAKNNECREMPRKRLLPDLDPNDSTRVHIQHYKNCTAEVLFYAIVGGGHTWPNGKEGNLIQTILGSTTRDLDTGQAAWDFFQGKIR